MIDRETLEKQALKSVCSCYYYDLADSLDNTDNIDLKKVIFNPMHFHFMQQKFNPVDPDEFIDEVMNCTEVKI